jgi:ribonuclease D
MKVITQPQELVQTCERFAKVFHAGRQDVEIIYAQAGLIPAPLFDTQIAAMVCGFGESIGYVNLVRKITGDELDKGARFTDWSRRPLSPKQLSYALADVTHLRDVYRRLAAELEATNRAHWVARPTMRIRKTRGGGSRCGSRTAGRWPF